MADRRPLVAVTGPIGSGKSSWLWGRAAMLAYEQPACTVGEYEGIRVTRGAVVRNTYKKLKDTTRVTFEEWFRPCRNRNDMKGWGYWSENDFVFHMGLTASLRDGGKWCVRHSDGTHVYCQLFFRAMESEADVENFKSLELTFGIANEYKYLPMKVLGAIAERTCRFPKIKHHGVAPVFADSVSCMWMDTNPFDIDSEHYRVLIENRDDNEVGYYKQPGGLRPDFTPNPHAENLAWLSKDYYLKKLAEFRSFGRSDTDIMRDLCGEYGYEADGRPVFAVEFSEGFHVARNPIEFDRGLGLVVGYDIGIQKCAMVAVQRDAYGCYRYLREWFETDMNSEDAADLLVRECRGHWGLDPRDVTVITDPFAKSRSASTGEDGLSIFRSRHFHVIASERALPFRLEAGRALMNRREGMLIDPRGCPMMVKGLLGGYYYRKKRDGTNAVEPMKNEYSDVIDAALYVPAYYEGNARRNKMARAWPDAAGHIASAGPRLMPSRLQPGYDPRARM